MTPARNVVPMKPYCRKCGATVRRLGRCPRCGKRNWQVFVWPFGMRH